VHAQGKAARDAGWLMSPIGDEREVSLSLTIFCDPSQAYAGYSFLSKPEQPRVRMIKNPGLLFSLPLRHGISDYVSLSTPSQWIDVIFSL